MKKKSYLKKFISYCLFALLFLIGCGGDDTGPTGWNGGEAAPRTPYISNLFFTGFPLLPPDTCLETFVDAGGGAITVGFSFDILDNDGDIKEAYVKVFDGTGTVKNKFIIDFMDYFDSPIGSFSGTWAIPIPLDTSTAGVYTFEISVSDIQGNLSNSLSAGCIEII